MSQFYIFFRLSVNVFYFNCLFQTISTYSNTFAKRLTQVKLRFGEVAELLTRSTVCSLCHDCPLFRILGFEDRILLLIVQGPGHGNRLLFTLVVVKSCIFTRGHRHS